MKKLPHQTNFLLKRRLNSTKFQQSSKESNIIEPWRQLVFYCKIGGDSTGSWFKHSLKMIEDPGSDQTLFPPSNQVIYDDRERVFVQMWWNNNACYVFNPNLYYQLEESCAIGPSWIALTACMACFFCGITFLKVWSKTSDICDHLCNALWWMRVESGDWRFSSQYTGIVWEPWRCGSCIRSLCNSRLIPKFRDDGAFGKLRSCISLLTLWSLNLDIGERFTVPGEAEIFISGNRDSLYSGSQESV